MSEIPVYVNCRDRVADLATLVEWLENAGRSRIVLVDNDSSYPPLLEYYERTPHEVLRLGGNYGSRSLWRSGQVPDEPFVFTDPDVIPIEECPADAIEFLAACLARWSWLDGRRVVKAALGMFLDDTPNFQSKPWEIALKTPDLRHLDGQVYCRRVGELAANGRVVEVHRTVSDTSFAVYPPRVNYGLFSLRTTWPYVARHTPWYRIADPTEEEQYYLSRAHPGPLGSSWAQGSQ